MIELPMWVEVVIGFAIMFGSLAIVMINTWYERTKRELKESEMEDLKKMMPKLPKEKSKNDSNV